MKFVFAFVAVAALAAGAPISSAIEGSARAELYNKKDRMVEQQKPTGQKAVELAEAREKAVAAASAKVAKAQVYFKPENRKAVEKAIAQRKNLLRH